METSKVSFNQVPSYPKPYNDPYKLYGIPSSLGEKKGCYTWFLITLKLIQALRRQAPRCSFDKFTCQAPSVHTHLSCPPAPEFPASSKYSSLCEKMNDS